MAKKNKKEKIKTPTFVTEFELEASSRGFSYLEKINNAYRQIYNATLGELKRNLEKARKSNEWQKARLLTKGFPERQKLFSEVKKQYRLLESEAQKIAALHRQGHLEELTNSRVVQQIAKRAFRAIEKVMDSAKNVMLQKK